MVSPVPETELQSVLTSQALLSKEEAKLLEIYGN
jgi:hypothetical protein